MDGIGWYPRRSNKTLGRRRRGHQVPHIREPSRGSRFSRFLAIPHMRLTEAAMARGVEDGAPPLKTSRKEPIRLQSPGILGQARYRGIYAPLCRGIMVPCWRDVHLAWPYAGFRVGYYGASVSRGLDVLYNMYAVLTWPLGAKVGYLD